MTILQKFRRKAESPAKLAGPGLIGLDIDAGQIHMCQIRPREHGMYTIIAKTSVSYSGTRDELLASPKRLKSLIDAGLKEFYRLDVYFDTDLFCVTVSQGDNGKP